MVLLLPLQRHGRQRNKRETPMTDGLLFLAAIQCCLPYFRSGSHELRYRTATIYASSF